MSRHSLGDDLGLYGMPDWIDRYDWQDLEEYLAKHAAFAEWLRDNDQ